MRRSATVVATLALGLSGLGLSACSSAAKSPTLPHKDFTPKAELDIHACPGLPSTATTACDEALTVHAPSDPFGPPLRSVADNAVLLVKNTAAGSRRVTGTMKDDQVFDTGQMASGNTTTIVLQTPGVVTITDTTTGRHTTLTVHPAPNTTT